MDQKGVKLHSLEFNGPILPLQIFRLCRLLRQTQKEFRLFFRGGEPYAALNNLSFPSTAQNHFGSAETSDDFHSVLSKYEKFDSMKELEFINGSFRFNT